MTRSHHYVIREGLLFARNPVLKYQKDVERKVPESKFQKIRPPKGYGPETLQKLLDAGVLFRAESNENGPNVNKDTFVRGWSLSDYMELETWPRDSSGGSTIRFGFPVTDDITITSNDEAVKEEKARIGEPSAAENALRKKSKNPHVLVIDGVRGLNVEIAAKERDCILFLSASYCRTCKVMDPMYTKMAQTGKEVFNNKITFAKADIAGTMGKMLARALDTETVPSFVFFKRGKEFGTPLGVRRLPSKKLDLALEFLRSGEEWDPELFREEDDATKST